MPPAPFFAAYTGRSMNPTLAEPELLEVVPCGDAPVRPGDVILFTHVGTKAQIVHRVARVTSAGLVTRGDNSAQDDADLCQPAEVRGRVVAAWRGQRRRVVPRGISGRLWAWSLRGRHFLLVLSVRLLSKPYHFIAGAGLLRRLLPPALRPRVLVFQDGGAQQYRLVIGHRVVGAYDAVRQAWHVQPPYLLFVDAASLPPQPPETGQVALTLPTETLPGRPGLPMERDALIEVLLTCLRPEGAENRAVHLAQLTPGEWVALLDLAKRQGVTPLLYRCLQPQATAYHVPADILRALRGEYLGNSARNAQLYHALGATLELFHREHVPVIVLKGAHLAAVVYRSIALRPMSDVDLLIRRSDMRRVESLLLANGYQPDMHNGPVTEAAHFHFVYHRAGPSLTLEIHWHLLPPGEADFVDVDRLWNAAMPARIAGVETQVLSPADLLLHLCLHLYHHRFEFGLRSLCDIAEVVHHYGKGLDWNQLPQRCRTPTARKVVYLALRLAQVWLHTPIPSNVLSELCLEDTLAWEAAVWEKVFNREATALAPGLVQVWGSQPPGRKALALLRGLFPSATTLAQVFPGSAGSRCYVAYYLRYLKQVFSKFSLTAWRLTRGDSNLRLLVRRLEALDQWLRLP